MNKIHTTSVVIRYHFLGNDTISFGDKHMGPWSPSLISLLKCLKLPMSTIAFFVFGCLSFIQLRYNAKQTLRWLKTVSSTYICMGRYNHSLSLDTTIMVSKHCPIIGEDVGIILVTQYVSIATV